MKIIANICFVIVILSCFAFAQDSEKDKTKAEGSGIGRGVGNGDGETYKPPVAPTKTPDEKNVSDIKILTKPKANYTDSARENNVSGIVRLKVTFNANGTIGAITPVSALPNGLTEQAIAAARSIKFQPRMVDGVAQTVVKTVEYVFTIYEKKVEKKAKIEKMPKTTFSGIKSETKFTGTVEVSIILRFDGKVLIEKIEQDLPKEYLDKIKETIATIKFTPATNKDGNPITAYRKIKFKFK